MAVSFILIKIISPERCSSLVFSINYKWQIVFIANQFVSVMKMFRKPVPVSASAFSIIKKCCGQTSTYSSSPVKQLTTLLYFSSRIHDLNTAYTCDRYQEVRKQQSILHRKCKTQSDKAAVGISDTDILTLLACGWLAGTCFHRQYQSIENKQSRIGLILAKYKNKLRVSCIMSERKKMRIWLKWYLNDFFKVLHVFLHKRHCSSTESIQCKEKKQDGNEESLNFHSVTQSAVNIIKASEETANRFTRRYHHCQDTR
ncbi:conserved hypothetical protein, partial [Trichinella spiralis]